MLYLWLIMLILLNTVWLLLVIFGLPGNWLIIISTSLFAWWRADDGIFSIYTLIFITALGVLGELIEFFAAMGGAKRAGASWVGSLGAIAGAIIGAIIGTIMIPIPLFGTLLGACLGAGLCAWSMELSRGKKMNDSIRFGIGAGLGHFLGTTIKFGLGVLIWLCVTIAAFWP